MDINRLPPNIRKQGIETKEIITEDDVWVAANSVITAGKCPYRKTFGGSSGMRCGKRHFSVFRMCRFSCTDKQKIRSRNPVISEG